MYVLDGLMQLLGQIRALDGRDGVILRGVLCALRCGRSQHHFRVVKEVFVYLKAIGRVANVYPVGKLGQRKLAPLEEDDVRHNLRPRIGAESVVG